MELLNESIAHGQISNAALVLIANFARIQDNLGWLLRDWEEAFPKNAKLLNFQRSHLKRMKDEKRVDLFLTATQELKTSASLKNFKNVFWRVKNTRDLMVHSTLLNFSFAEETPVINLPYYFGDSKIKSFDGQKSTVELVEVQKRVKEAHWLLLQIQWVAQEMKFRGGPGSLPTITTKPSEKP